MPASATFCDLPLSTSFSSDLEQSLLSLDWVLSSGIKTSGSVASGVLSLPCEGTTCVLNINLAIKDSLPFDLVLGRDWHLLCRDSLPDARFLLSSGMIDFALKAVHVAHSPNPSPMEIDDFNADVSHGKWYIPWSWVMAYLLASPRSWLCPNGALEFYL
ncbi:hypothetical protein MSAN_01692700 [Mycena sanguinolenta]|uniref:Uncharacterized protein n=1 Tax=Mycena sanguinolenta TaxID=230812 RepID=A0A8H7CVF0_9AGAR|nr:hypothetical protein MSAN_01692700 [Mycena sanguinolenta]